MECKLGSRNKASWNVNWEFWNKLEDVGSVEEGGYVGVDGAAAQKQVGPSAIVGVALMWVFVVATDHREGIHDVNGSVIGKEGPVDHASDLVGKCQERDLFSWIILVVGHGTWRLWIP